MIRGHLNTLAVCEITSRNTCARVAVAGRNLQRASLHGLFPAVRPELAMLDCLDAIDRGGLVFGAKFKPTMVAQFAARIHRRRCLFHSNVQLVRFAWSVIRKFLAPRIIVAALDLSRT